MAKVVIALYDNMEDARAAVLELLEHNFTHNDISVVVHDPERELGDDAVQPIPLNNVAGGVGVGALLGGATGLLASAFALVIPGIGPALAAGPLAATLLGAGVGAAAGGLVGVLTDLGVNEEAALYYAEGVRRGGILVAVRALGDLNYRAVEILERHRPADMAERVFTWRQQGWDGFDIEANPDEAEAMARAADFYEHELGHGE